jgi:hypothetical protein
MPNLKDASRSKDFSRRLIAAGQDVLMKLSDALISVCRQALVEDANSVQLEGKKYPIKRTSRNRLRQVDFGFEGLELRGRNKTLKRNRDGRNWPAKAKR